MQLCNGYYKDAFESFNGFYVFVVLLLLLLHMMRFSMFFQYNFSSIGIKDSFEEIELELSGFDGEVPSVDLLKEHIRKEDT